MNPSDTQIERMSDLFAEKYADEKATTDEAKAAWNASLKYARTTGALDKIASTMADEGQNTEITAAWDRAAEY